jgi:hypothetical protein
MCAFPWPLTALFLALLTAQERPTPAPLIRISPTDFFSGELRRLKDHVDFDAACFKVARRGPVRCGPSLEVWCDGEIVGPGKLGGRGDRLSEEVTLSWRRITTWDNRLQYRLKVGGMSTFGFVLDEPKSRQEVQFHFGPVTIAEPVELKSERDSAVVWVLGAGRATDRPDIDLSDRVKVQKMLDTAPWVVVLRLIAMKEK